MHKNMFSKIKKQCRIIVKNMCSTLYVNKSFASLQDAITYVLKEIDFDSNISIELKSLENIDFKI